MGLAINDNTYINGYKECLDFYRDNAIKSDGRVLARWAYNNVDIMPDQITNKGFYEAQWGFLSVAKVLCQRLQDIIPQNEFFLRVLNLMSVLTILLGELSNVYS